MAAATPPILPALWRVTRSPGVHSALRRAHTSLHVQSAVRSAVQSGPPAGTAAAAAVRPAVGGALAPSDVQSAVRSAQPAALNSPLTTGFWGVVHQWRPRLGVRRYLGIQLRRFNTRRLPAGDPARASAAPDPAQPAEAHAAAAGN